MVNELAEFRAYNFLSSVQFVISLLSHVIRLFLNYELTFSLDSISFTTHISKVLLKWKFCCKSSSF